MEVRQNLLAKGRQLGPSGEGPRVSFPGHNTSFGPEKEGNQRGGIAAGGKGFPLTCPGEGETERLGIKTSRERPKVGQQKLEKDTGGPNQTKKKG